MSITTAGARRTWSITAAALLLVSAGVFLAGHLAERSAGHSEATSVESVEGGHPEVGKSAPVEAGGGHADSAETVAGLQLESTPLALAVVLAGLVLALLVWRRPALPVCRAALHLAVAAAAAVLAGQAHRADRSEPDV